MTCLPFIEFVSLFGLRAALPPVKTTILPSRSISTRATVTPAAATALIAAVTSRCLKVHGPLAI